MKYKLAIFDLDGTILDTLEDLKDSLNYILKKNNFPERSLIEVKSFIGNGIRKLIERSVPTNTTTFIIDNIYNEFNNFYKIHCADKTKPYDGIIDLLNKLKNSGCLTAVVSNKADYGVQKLCEYYFKDLFNYTIGEREGIKRKPAPDSVNEVLNKLKISSKDAVYIGDSDVDLDTAKNANMDCIAVSWGFRGHEFLINHGAKIVVDTAKEIEAIILEQ
ncbi:MAG: HAD family hydrolase [Anaeroplasma sp.]